VAETVEVLRKSPFTLQRPKPRSLAGVLDLAEQLDTRLYQWPSFVRFIELVEQADRAKPHRRGGGRY